MDEFDREHGVPPGGEAMTNDDIEHFGTVGVYSSYEAEVTVRVTPINQQPGPRRSPFGDREAKLKLRVQVEGDDLEASARAIAHAVDGAKQAIEKVVDPGRGSATARH